MPKSPDFEIQVKAAKSGKVITIKQLTGVQLWDPMFGNMMSASVDPVILTPFETELLVKEINEAIRIARTK